jgi:hypothetical protein
MARAEESFTDLLERMAAERRIQSPVAWSMIRAGSDEHCLSSKLSAVQSPLRASTYDCRSGSSWTRSRSARGGEWRHSDWERGSALRRHRLRCRKGLVFLGRERGRPLRRYSPRRDRRCGRGGSMDGGGWGSTSCAAPKRSDGSPVPASPLRTPQAIPTALQAAVRAAAETGICRAA